MPNARQQAMLDFITAYATEHMRQDCAIITLQKECRRGADNTRRPTGKGLPMHSSNDTTICSVAGCGRQTRTAGMCQTHYERVRKTGDPQAHIPIKRQLPHVRPGCSLEDRLWSKVDRSGGPDACWPWLGAHDRHGYGSLGIDGKTVKAYRLAWELAHGPIPPGMSVCHRCDNPPCCNPYRCLFLGTQAENMADCARKGRNRWTFGEGNPFAKLTETRVVEMRQRYAAGGVSYRELGCEYGVCETTANKIVHGEKWRHVPGAIERRSHRSRRVASCR